jgi:AraC-like DNA-binding protein
MRLLPDGCLDLVWDGRHALIVRPADRLTRRPVGESASVTGIRIRPGWAAVISGTPALDLPGIADLADVWDPATARQLVDALAAAASPAARCGVLTDAVARRLAGHSGPDPRVLAAVSVLGRPRATVSTAAGHAGLSSRQLRRLFDQHVGLPPKTLHSILRFQRLRAWLASGPALGSLGRAAADCGYFDQAHLCRECTRLGGLTPATLLAAAASNTLPALAGPTAPMNLVSAAGRGQH